MWNVYNQHKNGNGLSLSFRTLVIMNKLISCDESNVDFFAHHSA